MNEYQEKLVSLTAADLARMKKTVLPVRLTGLFFGLLCAGVIVLFIKTIFDPGFRASDGYIVAGFLGFIGLLCAIVFFERVVTAKRLLKSIENGNKQIITTRFINLTREGPATSKIIKHYLKMGNGQSLLVSVLDKKAIVGIHSLYDLKEGDFIEIQLAHPGNVIISLIRK
jgi:hypothetical protein